MAEVPTVNAPRVTQSGAPLGISAPPAAFGAGVLGEGLKEAGQATGQFADTLQRHAQAIQEINNNAAADTAGAAAIPAMNKIFSDYYTNVNGPQASARYDEYAQRIEATRAQFAGTLNPAAAQLFHQQTRRVMAGLFSSMRSHADSEQAQWVKNSTQAATLAQWGAYAANPTDENLNHAVMSNVDNYDKMAGFDLGAVRAPDGRLMVGDTDISAQRNAAVSQNFVKVLEGLAGAAPIQAYELAQRHSDLLFGADKAVVGKLRRLADPEYAAIDARDITAPLASGAVSPRAATGEFASLSPAEVTSNLRADPEGFIQSVTGIRPHLTSGARTPAQNAAAGGSPTSEHLSNQAWDFTPPPGTSMAQLANAIEASGIPYDQLEVTPTHVHVGLRQGNLRREVIGPLAGQVQGVNPPGTPPNSVQMNGNRDYALQQAHDRAVARYPDDPGLQAQYELRLRGAVESQFNQVVGAQRANEAESAAGIYQEVEAGNLEDISQLSPQARKTYDGLPHNVQLGIDSAFNRNANQLTDARVQNHNYLVGLQAEHPDQFAAADLSQFDLTRADRMKFSGAQAKGQVKLQAQANTMRDYRAALASPTIADGLRATGIKPGTASYLTFAGALQGELEAWEAANPGKHPGMKDFEAIGRGLFGQRAYGNYLFGQRVGDAGTQYEFLGGPTDAERQEVLNLAQQAGQPAPNDQQIAETVHLLRSARRGR